MAELVAYVLWAAGGVGVGLLLSWWQRRSIRKYEHSAPEKTMARIYLTSLPRVLLVSALLFAAMTQSIWFGICFAVGFTVSRWVWALLALRKITTKDD